MVGLRERKPSEWCNALIDTRGIFRGGTAEVQVGDHHWWVNSDLRRGTFGLLPPREKRRPTRAPCESLPNVVRSVCGWWGFVGLF